MPGRRTKLTFAAAAAVVGALLVAGCAGTENHTWQSEFTERLEGASAAIEEKLGELRSTSSEGEILKAGTVSAERSSSRPN
jgi:outer membrane murein-binding lipoprotein Lpp